MLQTLSPTKAKTVYIDPTGQQHPLALMGRSEAIAAIQELQTRMLDLRANSIAQRSINPLLAAIDASLSRFHVDSTHRQVHDMQSGKSARFTPATFAIVEALFAARGTVVETGALIAHVWGHKFDTETDCDNVLKVFVSKIRRAFEAAEFPLQVRNRWGTGYFIYFETGEPPVKAQ